MESKELPQRNSEESQEYPDNPENRREKTIDDIKIEMFNQTNEKIEEDYLDILHQWPKQYILGEFEEFVRKDLENSDIAIAYDGETPVGCMLLTREDKREQNWLATRRVEGVRNREIADKLFKSFYSLMKPGEAIYSYVNTEDATSDRDSNFTGASFEPARRLYIDLGYLEEDSKDRFRIDNYYGPGGHVYEMKWIPNPITPEQEVSGEDEG